jgi:hypothetical protein
MPFPFTKAGIDSEGIPSFSLLFSLWRLLPPCTRERAVIELFEGGCCGGNKLEQQIEISGTY